MNIDGLILLGIFAVLFGPGIYYTWKGRINGRFKIVQRADNEYDLMYGYQCEWILDSTHKSVKEAEDKVDFYSTRRANRPTLMP